MDRGNLMPEEVSSSENHAELMAIRDSIDTFGEVLSGLVESANETQSAISTTLSGIATTLAGIATTLSGMAATQTSLNGTLGETNTALEALDLAALTEEMQKIRIVAEDSHTRSVALQEAASIYLADQTQHAESYLDRTDTPDPVDTTPPDVAVPPPVVSGGANFAPVTLNCPEGGSCLL